MEHPTPDPRLSLIRLLPAASPSWLLRLIPFIDHLLHIDGFELNDKLTDLRTVREQLRNNAVALISLAIALSSLAYNTWRNETTEEQRNVRHAAFRVMESLGDLQEVVDMRYFYLPFDADEHRESDTRLRGYGNVIMVRDLMSLLPAPAPASGRDLHHTWQEQFVELHQLDERGDHTAAASEAERALTQAIDASRATVVELLARLD